MNNAESAAPAGRDYSRLGKGLIGIGISAAFRDADSNDIEPMEAPEFQ